MFCTNCGNKITSDEKFCTHCGQARSIAERTMPDQINSVKIVDIFDDENSIVVDDKYDVTTYDFFPESKRFTIDSSIKDDCFFNYLTYEYKISTIPIGLQCRLLEKSYEPPPPRQYEVKDGVVLESEMLKGKEGYFLKSAKDQISDLKKQTEWSKAEILGNFEVNLYILSKHPEIISKEEYRKFLRQSVETIKAGVLKAEEAVKQDDHGLEISSGEYGKSIWYPNTDAEKNEMSAYYDLPEDKRGGTDYAKKLEYIEKFNSSLFNEDSPKYVGIPEHEFRNNNELVEYLEKVLDNKHITSAKKENVVAGNSAGSKMKWAIVIVLSIIALSWGVWTAIGVFVLGSIIIGVISK